MLITVFILVKLMNIYTRTEAALTHVTLLIIQEIQAEKISVTIHAQAPNIIIGTLLV